MNVYARNLNKNNKKKPRTQESSLPSGSGALLAAFSIVLLIGTALGIFWLRISLKEKIQKLNREEVQIKREIHKLDREMANLRIQKERLCDWEHINRKINEYGIALRPPKAGQVKVVKRSRKKKDSDAESSKGVAFFRR